MSTTQLSIIIPAFNEEKRIGDTLDKIYGYMSSSKFSYEILVVDDGSSDGTIDEAGKSRAYLAGTLRVLSNSGNRGKGYSVRHGIKKSAGNFILFTDADLSTPISEIDKLFLVINEGFDIVIGSRSVNDSSVEVSQAWYRQGMGKVFNYLVRTLLRLPFRDTQCGFKLMKGDIARCLADKMQIDDFCFDVEFLYLAAQKGHKIKETGVVWKNSPMSKVKVFSSSLGMFMDLFRIKFSKR